jgi:hypothetical protein
VLQRQASDQTLQLRDPHGILVIVRARVFEERCGMRQEMSLAVGEDGGRDLMLAAQLGAALGP